MKNYGLRYIAILGCLIFLFCNFVACGTQLYQLSLEQDTDNKRTQVQAGAANTYGLHSPGGWKKLPIAFKVSAKMSTDQVQGLLTAMKTWEWSVGKPLFQFLGKSEIAGDDFKDLYSSLTDLENGHYLDYNWEKTGKPKTVLATTIWENTPSDPASIDTADIRFNANYYLISNALTAKTKDNKEVVDMQSLALHELGHLLGLAHIDPKDDPDSVMNPSLFIGEGLVTRRLSKKDIQRVQKVYGCLGNACNVDKLFTDAEQGKPSESQEAEIEKDSAEFAH
jgi:hypothetical protein